MNNVNIAGRIARDFEIFKDSKDRINGIKGTLAYNSPKTGRIQFHSFRLKGKLCPLLSKIGHKGDKLIISGSLSQDFYEVDNVERRVDFIEVESFYVVPKRGEQDAD